MKLFNILLLCVIVLNIVFCFFFPPTVFSSACGWLSAFFLLLPKVLKE